MRAMLPSLTLVAALLLATAAQASPYPLEQILEPAAVEKLAKEKVVTSDDLLARGAKPAELKALAKSTGLAIAKLTAWTKMCDLLRLKGVGPEMVKLLNAARVQTVKQLRVQKAGPLLKAMLKANDKQKITEKPPSEDQVGSWIEQAKKLEIVLK